MNYDDIKKFNSYPLFVQESARQLHYQFMDLIDHLIRQLKCDSEQIVMLRDAGMLDNLYDALDLTIYQEINNLNTYIDSTIVGILQEEDDKENDS